MNTKKLTLIIVFIALTAALNIAGPKIPAPYAPFLIYQLWEIPIVVAFIAIGPKAGIVITDVHVLRRQPPAEVAGGLLGLLLVLGAGDEMGKWKRLRCRMSSTPARRRVQ